MVERLGRDARDTLRRARAQAQAHGDATVEAQHMLLVLTEAPGRAGRVLVTLGLTEQSVREALDREVAGALAAVGVHDSQPAGRMLPTRGRRVPRWGQSAKLALKRTLHEARRRGERRLGNEHLLLAVVSAEAGVIPRVLDELQISPAQVREALE
jgi:ATP-dependent Clp protease ATP-binding subunit ClpA